MIDPIPGRAREPGIQKTDARRPTMTMTYTRLPARTLDKSAGLLRPACVLPERVGLDNPALDVMTDFRRLTAFIATPGDTIRQAEERMIRRKVRLLFVMDGEDRVAGLITSTDIHGEKPLLVVQGRGIRRDEVLVADIMTPVERLEAVDFDDIAHARVGHVLETLKARGRQHALVIEHTADGQMVRGLLSLSQLCKQLGVNIETTEVANTFIEIEQQLAHV
jgi:CBS domain containing-hemolysin-like protein